MGLAGTVSPVMQLLEGVWHVGEVRPLQKKNPFLQQKKNSNCPQSPPCHCLPTPPPHGEGEEEVTFHFQRNQSVPPATPASAPWLRLRRQRRAAPIVGLRRHADIDVRHRRRPVHPPPRVAVPRRGRGRVRTAGGGGLPAGAV